MTDVRASQDAVITYELIRWLSAHCSEHETFTDECVACHQVPQCCLRHPMKDGTYPGFNLGCQDCYATRPGYETIEVVGEQVMTAEQACQILGLPYGRVSSKFIRVPLNLLRRTR